MSGKENAQAVAIEKGALRLEVAPGEVVDGKEVRAVVIGRDGVARKVFDPHTDTARADSHELTFTGADKELAHFVCVRCPNSISFALPGKGEPAAVPDGDGFSPPPGFMEGMDPCTPPQS